MLNNNVDHLHVWNVRVTLREKYYKIMFVVEVFLLKGRFLFIVYGDYLEKLLSQIFQEKHLDI